ncbi:RND transporter [Erwinia sp. S43]|uniref:RND transporter n=1 Tax=Erwinia sp. S43 TaxID=2769339 RepID=UPI00190D60BC|nr:RND transporter [Erwinia sp. S43]MBK0035816.1 RND transporter [Erwinia sp. S43]
MRKIIVLSLVSALASFSHVAQATDCEPNDLGGYSCLNDDDSTSDSMPNEMGGTDTISSKGGFTSTDSGDDEADAELDGSSLNSANDSASMNTNDALKGRDWNAPSNINDGAATSSLDMTNHQ